MKETRVLTEAEAELLVRWAAEEGWNPGIDDARAFHVADPDGFFGCFVEGEMAAGIGAIAYDERFGFIGLYICRPESRGMGFGRAVWDAGLTHLGARTIGLDGVPAQQANYRAMGFAPAYDTLRYAGRPQGQGGRHAADGWSIEPYRPALRDVVMAFDRACFPSPRTSFMDRWLQAPRQAFTAMRDGRLGGFGVVRPTRAGRKIGPLFAQDLGAATALFLALADAAPDHVCIDVPESQQVFRTALTASGMLSGFTTARMYRGGAPQLRSEWIYGVTTLELG